MNDNKTTINDLKQLVEGFVAERDWHQFHSPKNISMSIAVEASELMQIFTFLTTDQSVKEAQINRQEVEKELADVVIAALCFANATKIDLATAIASKVAEIKAKYPVEKAKGRCDKYTTYQ